MKRALVTGSFRRLGAEIAVRLAREGYQVALHGRRGSDPEAWVVAAIGETGMRCTVVHADFTMPGEVAGLVAAAERQLGGPLGLLVNNAAQFRSDEGCTTSHANLLEHFTVNTMAGILLAQDLRARLGPEGRAAVINILDQRVAAPPSDQLAYTLSKQAAAEATRTLARALAPQVRVCGVAPGLTIPTEGYDAGQIERLAELMPLRRLPQPQDIADAVVYLAAASSVTGEVIFVDGGAHLESFQQDFINLKTG